MRNNCRNTNKFFFKGNLLLEKFFKQKICKNVSTSRKKCQKQQRKRQNFPANVGQK